MSPSSSDISRSHRRWVAIAAAAFLTITCTLGPPLARAEQPEKSTLFAGTWTLVAADVISPDGKRKADYGPAPKGLLLVDGHDHYSLQIYNSERPKFVSGDRAKGTPDEYRTVSLGMSTHFGTLTVNQTNRVLTFNIENASFPNREGSKAACNYELRGDELSYTTPPRPDGSTAVSVWRRMK